MIGRKGNESEIKDFDDRNDWVCFDVVVGDDDGDGHEEDLNGGC